MVGDLSDFLNRLKATLPVRWFPDSTPVLDSLLSGLCSAWVLIYDLLNYTQLQSRIATASGDFLDGVSADFFGKRLARRLTESDQNYRVRIQKALVREHATRSALTSVLLDLTGHSPVIFEPARVADTGAYSCPTLGYCTTGAWGSLQLPFQVFVGARRMSGGAIAVIAGYGTGGPLARGNLNFITGQASDLEIASAIASVLPSGTIAWTSINN